MQRLYIVFDKLPKKEDGGLIATYERLVKELREDFDIRFISIFAYGKNDISGFDKTPIETLSPFEIDNRFFMAFQHLKKGDALGCLKSLASALYFFLFIPIAKHKTKRILSNEMVIATSPAAAIFLSKRIRYILEIHINYEYFYGSNLLGRMQGILCPPPALTLFRNKTDAAKASAKLHPDYIYNGFDEESLPQIEANRKKYSALFVGRLEPQKNPLLLLQCAKLVHNIIPEFTLDIYGTGSLQLQLEQEIKKMKLQGYVRLMGFTSDKSVYSNYKIFWLTSVQEGFGLVLTESMANKTPVVTINWGDACKEIVSHGNVGYVCEDKNSFVKASVRILTDEKLWRQFSLAAFDEFKQRFSAKQNRQRWLELLEKTYGDTESAQNTDHQNPELATPSRTKS